MHLTRILRSFGYNMLNMKDLMVCLKKLLLTNLPEDPDKEKQTKEVKQCIKWIKYGVNTCETGKNSTSMEYLADVLQDICLNR